MDNDAVRKISVALPGISLGIGLRYSIPWEHWPLVNYGLQLIVISAAAYLYLIISNKIHYSDAREMVIGIILGICIGHVLEWSETIHTAGLLLVCSFILTFFGARLHASLPLIASQLLFAGISISVLSIFAKGAALMEIVVLFSFVLTLIYFRKKISADLRFTSSLALFSLIVGAWIFRHQNGNLDLIGIDAGFNISLAIVCYIAIYSNFSNCYPDVHKKLKR